MVEWTNEAIAAAIEELDVIVPPGNSWENDVRLALDAAVKAQRVDLLLEAAEATLEDEQAAHEDTLRLLKNARAEALEEAAKVIESRKWWGNAEQAATAIRALKDKP